MSAIEVDQLTVRYGDVVAVRDLSFTAEAGAVTCILGRNGAGKTSTIEALEGIRHPSGGRLSVLGLDPQRQRRLLSRRAGVMLQDGGIHPAARTGELVRHAAALYPRSQAHDPTRLLERVGLDGLEDRTFRQLSGGEQRRLALALALVGRPEVAFLDEPTAGVDPAGRQVIRSIVGDLRSQGVTVLLSTHDLDEAQRLADRVVIIHDGRLRAAGTITELTAAAHVPDDQAMRFHGPAGLDVAALSHHLGGPHHEVPVHEEAPGRYVVRADPTPWLVATVTVWLAERDIPLADLQTGQLSLEDAFLRLTSPPSPGGPDDDAGGERPPRAATADTGTSTGGGTGTTTIDVGAGARRGHGDDDAGPSATADAGDARPAAGERPGSARPGERDAAARGHPRTGRPGDSGPGAPIPSTRRARPGPQGDEPTAVTARRPAFPRRRRARR